MSIGQFLGDYFRGLIPHIPNERDYGALQESVFGSPSAINVTPRVQNAGDPAARDAAGAYNTMQGGILKDSAAAPAFARMPSFIGLPLLTRYTQGALERQGAMDANNATINSAKTPDGSFDPIRLAIAAGPETLSRVLAQQQTRRDAQRTEDLAQLDQGTADINAAMTPKDVGSLGAVAPGLSWRGRLALHDQQQKQDYQKSPEYLAEVARQESEARLPSQRQLIGERSEAVLAREAERNAEEERRAQYDLSDPADLSVAKAWATYKARLPSAGRNPMQRKAALAAALKLNPEYNEAKYDQVQKAMRDFGTGRQGDIARSLNVSVAHLETLRELGRALQNGDVNAINAAKQSWQEAFGTAAPTNFDTAKAIVADEVAKGVIGGTTAQSDRQTLAESLLRSRSPDQINGAIDTFQDLLGGQLGGLRDQHKRTTTLDNFDEEFLSDRTRKALGSRGGKGAKPASNKIFDDADAILRGGR
jgi:hypothetical protein